MRCRRELRRRPHKRFPPLPSSRATSALVLEGRILMVCNTMCMMYTTITPRGVANAAMPSRKNPSWTSTRRNGVISIPPPLIFQAMAAAGNRRGQELLGVPDLPFSRSLAWILLLDLETWDSGGPCYRSLTVLWSADGFGHFPWKIASMESVNGDAVDFGKKNAVQEAPPKKPSFGQKKQLEAVGSSPAPASKKQKVSGALSDKSIDQLNDVTAVSGVNLQKEEEQLFSTNKEDSRVSKASRRAVQEDEERLILQKTPLQKKVAEIMSKCGLKNASNDVEKCLSLSVEERVRSLISNIIRMSKQRIDLEKARHKTVVTSDVRQQLVVMNQKAKDEWDRKLAEAELRRVNEPDTGNGAEGDKETEGGRGKAPKLSKEEDVKMRTRAANMMAARAAVGGDDLMSKWKLILQARQNREGGHETAFSPQSANKDGSCKPQSFCGRNGVQDGTTKRFGSGSCMFEEKVGGKKFGRSKVAGAQLREVRSLTIKEGWNERMEREAQRCQSRL